MISYQNPVWPGYFADPFVLRVGDQYYAYGTGSPDESGRQFPILQSTDLAHWTHQGAALVPLSDPPAFSYWAPEVAEKDGKFYMYYSASTSESDEHQHLRVAIADAPLGPFIDSGRRLFPDTGFTIDPSPFQDPQDGKRYLFFAADFENDEPTGTGLKVAPLSDDMLSISGQARTVLRAAYSWQIYETNRNYKGKLWPKWHCVEGPNVVYHDGAYYCFFSGGSWRCDNYGVSFAKAQHPLGPWSQPTGSDGPTVLRGVPHKVIGPGHNSTVVAPDNKTLFMVYHAWNLEHTARQICIDPIRWLEHGPKVDGPSKEPKTVV